MSQRSQQAKMFEAGNAASSPGGFAPRSLRLMSVKETAMTTIDHTTPTARFATRTNTVARLVQGVSHLYRAFKNRREF